MKPNPNKIDAVFEGGGVKGSAFVGAVEITEQQGYVFENLAGTSAGSLMAALLAVGYLSSEIKKFMDEVDYLKFQDPTMLDQTPLIGKSLNLLLTEGIYKGDYVTQWIAGLLAQKNITTFKDLIIPEYSDDPKFRYKLQVIASDITNGKLLVLPNDAKDYGINPDDLNVALALRMSISIPFFFEPVILRKNNLPSFVVDGGILSNFPVWLLDDPTTDPPWPTFGYKLVDPDQNKPHNITGPIKFLEAMFSTMSDAHDARYIKDHDFARTVPIPTLGIQSTDFGITQIQKDALYQSGKDAATKFFQAWDFEMYKKKYPPTADSHRTQRLWEK